MGTGIINLARNIGASVGIATVTTLLERRTQFHMAHLMEHVNPYSPAYHKTVIGHGGLMAGRLFRQRGKSRSGHGLFHGPAAGHHACLPRQFQDAWRRLLRHYPDPGVHEEAQDTGGEFLCTGAAVNL